METNPTTNDQMKRGDFLRSLGLSSAALMAFYCMGTTMTACSSKSDPTPATPTTPGTGTGTGTGTTPTTTSGFTGNADASKGTVDFTLDLTDANYKSLTTKGNYVYQSNILVALTSPGSYVAVSKICTHEGTTLEYKSDEDNFYCPNHGSRFTDAGAVKNGPASKPIQAFKTALSADGKQLRVTA